MYRVFLSHSRRDNAAARAVFRWLTDNEPSLEGDIFLDVNPNTGFAPGSDGSLSWLAQWITRGRHLPDISALEARIGRTGANQMVAASRHGIWQVPPCPNKQWNE